MRLCFTWTFMDSPSILTTEHLMAYPCVLAGKSSVQDPLDGVRTKLASSDDIYDEAGDCHCSLDICLTGMHACTCRH